MELQQIVGRVADIRNAKPSPAVRQRVAESAAGLSQAGDMQMRLEMAIEALAALIVILYEKDADGWPANVERRTGKILVPVPWGARADLWTLRRLESRALRMVLMDRVRKPRRLPALFDYSDDNRRWYLNTQDYPTADAALAWLKKDAPSLPEWRTAVLAMREDDLERKRKPSGRKAGWALHETPE